MKRFDRDHTLVNIAIAQALLVNQDEWGLDVDKAIVMHGVIMDFIHAIFERHEDKEQGAS